jgi:hypothetical protein
VDIELALPCHRVFWLRSRRMRPARGRAGRHQEHETKSKSRRGRHAGSVVPLGAARAKRSLWPLGKTRRFAPARPPEPRFRRRARKVTQGKVTSTRGGPGDRTMRSPRMKPRPSGALRLAWRPARGQALVTNAPLFNLFNWPPFPQTKRLRYVFFGTASTARTPMSSAPNPRTMSASIRLAIAGRTQRSMP